MALAAHCVWHSKPRGPSIERRKGNHIVYRHGVSLVARVQTVVPNGGEGTGSFQVLMSRARMPSPSTKVRGRGEAADAD